MVINFKSENLVVDWISFNIQGLPDPETIASGLSKYFTPHILIDGEPKMPLIVITLLKLRKLVGRL